MNFFIDPNDDAELKELFSRLAREDAFPRLEFYQSLRGVLYQQLQEQQPQQRRRFWPFRQGGGVRRRLLWPSLGFAVMAAVLLLAIWFGGEQLYDWNPGENVAYLTVQEGDILIYRSQHIIGDVELTRQLRAAAGETVTVHEGDTIISEHDASAEIRFPDQSRVLVSGDTQLAVPTIQKRSASTPLAIIMRLDRGAVRSKVAHLREGIDRFEIDAPNLTAQVKGTVFRMNVDSKGTRVATEEGVVSVIWDGQTVDVVAGNELQLLLTGETAHYDLRPQSPLLFPHIGNGETVEDGAPIYTNATEIAWDVRALPDTDVYFYVNDELVQRIRVDAKGRGSVSYAPEEEGSYTVWAVTQVSTGEQSLPSPAQAFIVDRTPPALVILQPTEPQVEKPTIVLEGRTEPGATLMLNGQTLSVDEGGHFITSQSLELGANSLELVAVDRAGNEVHLTSVIIYEKMQ